ncbi:hypothetical protein BH11CYA1_BH11CYA1_32290 [soil metagenome]
MLRKTFFLLSTAALLVCGISLEASSVEAKSKSGARRGAYLVPPPPAYAPSILPMMRGASGTLAYSREVIVEESAEEKAPADEKIVYVKTYGTASAIKPTSSRKGISTY